MRRARGRYERMACGFGSNEPRLPCMHMLSLTPSSWRSLKEARTHRQWADRSKCSCMQFESRFLPYFLMQRQSVRASQEPVQATSAYTYETAAVDVPTRRRARAPWLLLFVHIERTGGTSLQTWLQQRASTGDLDLYVPPRVAECFLVERFPAAFNATQGTTCGTHSEGLDRACISRGRNASTVDWRKSRIAVALGIHADASFLRRVLPSLGQLRERYAERHGTVLTLTLVREPLAFMASAIRTRAPCHEADPARLRACIAALADTAAGVAGAQSRRLALLQPRSAWSATAPPRPWPWHDTGAHRDGCSETASAGQAALAALDLAAPTGCLLPLLRTVASQLGLRVPRRVPHKAAPSQRHQAASSSTAAPALERSLARARPSAESAAAPAHAAAECDRPLYDEAIRRARVDLADGCRVTPPPAIATKRPPQPRGHAHRHGLVEYLRLDVARKAALAAQAPMPQPRASWARRAVMQHILSSRGICLTRGRLRIEGWRLKWWIGCGTKEAL